MWKCGKIHSPKCGWKFFLHYVQQMYNEKEESQ